MGRRAATLCLVSLICAGLVGVALGQDLTAIGGGGGRRLAVDLPSLTLSGGRFDLTLRPTGEGWPADGTVEVAAGERQLARRHVRLREDGALRAAIPLEDVRAPGAGSSPITVRVLHHARVRSTLRVIPAWLSILPPLLAILLAVLLREVVVALVAGIWLGATFIHGYDPFAGLLRTADTYAVGALADGDHASIAIFSLLLGGMIGVIARSGGALGMAELVTRVAKNRLTGALATWLMGLAIFFDDYSNSLLVGTTMRPITDRLRISREKLAFLVDATAAPVSSFAVVSSWVGVEVGYIADQYAALGLEGDPYLVFLETIPYRFYPLLMLWFGLMLVLFRRDFGPMATAERRAVHEGALLRPGADPASDFEADELSPPEGADAHWIGAVVPIVVVIVTAMGGMYVTGHDALIDARQDAVATRDAAAAAVQALEGTDRAAALEAARAELADARRALGLLDVNVRNVFGKADSLKALLWSALLGGLVAILLAVGRRVLTVRQSMEAWVAGVRSIALAVMILVLAWSLGKVCEELHTADFVIAAIGDWLPAWTLPATVFVIAALVSFATGTSWGTMGILFPLVLPLAHELAPADDTVVLSSVASILSGSVWGDHCSPISDTTIMSSMATSCDHVDHVRTQLPYALAVGVVSLLVGELATGAGLWGPALALPIGAALLVVLVRFAGRRVEG
ncbi:MAG TPA: Na+/H+ antiporter NhaC family protein [Sandaracinaceae bacterium LLY-WYZ-13_1]|nr:Na+/H+ antiporter NhaC family protein [Sandaracinaceae bacterium LLY-WYZ-13_1]